MLKEIRDKVITYVLITQDNNDLLDIERLLLVADVPTCELLIEQMDNCLGGISTIAWGTKEEQKIATKLFKKIKAKATRVRKQTRMTIANYLVSGFRSEFELIDSLDEEECEFCLDSLARLQRPTGVKIIREAIRVRSDVIERNKSHEVKFAQFLPKIDLLYKQLRNLPAAMESTHNSELFEYATELAAKYGETVSIHKVAYRIIGTMLFDVPYIPLGLASTGCVESFKKDKEFNRVVEHFFPRGTVAGPALLKFFESEKADSIENFIIMLFTFCQVVYTTAKENNSDLTQYQGIDTALPPKEAYEAANIELIRTNNYVPPYLWVMLFDYYNMDIPIPYDFGV